MGSIGLPGILLLIILALLLFGPKKLPELGRAIGRTFKEFKEGAQGIVNEPEQSQSDSQKAVSTIQDSVHSHPKASGEVQSASVKAENNQRLPD